MVKNDKVFNKVKPVKSNKIFDKLKLFKNKFSDKSKLSKNNNSSDRLKPVNSNSFFGKIIGVLFHPKKFYGELKEPTIKDARKFSLILSFFVAFGFGMINPFLKITTTGIGERIAIFLGYWITLFLGFFVLAWILNLWIKIFGGKGTYRETFQIFIYSLTPIFLFPAVYLVARLFSWSRYAGAVWDSFLFGIPAIYSLLLLSLGTFYYYKVSKNNILWMYGIVLLIVLMVFFG